MPITKSASKRLRQTIKREKHNLAIKRNTKSQIKSVLKSIALNDKKNAETAFITAQSQIDRMAKKGLIHKNKAARQKSRLAKALASSTTEKSANAKKAKTATVAKPKTTRKKPSVKKSTVKK